MGSMPEGIIWDLPFCIFGRLLDSVGGPNLPEIEFSAAGGRPERNRVAFLSEFCLKVVFVRYVLQFWLDLARNFNGNAEAFNLFYRNT